MTAQKVCPVVYRKADGGVELLAFRHPSAGNQFVKGTIEDGELPALAATRELFEESGITRPSGMRPLGGVRIGVPEVVWHFFASEIDGFPERWEHRTHDDMGHVFSFFWHPLADDLDDGWHPQFHAALRAIRDLLRM